jgi:outer membrane protein insertion porin family
MHLTVSILQYQVRQTYDPLTGLYDPSVADSRYISTTGATISLAKQLKWPDDFFSLSMGINYTRYKLSNYLIDPTNLPGFENGMVNNINFRIALQRSSVDQPLFPRIRFYFPVEPAGNTAVFIDR